MNNLSKTMWKVLMDESIEAIRQEVDTDVPVSLILLLLAMPEKGQISFREIEKRTNISHSACSRGLAILAGMGKLKKTTGEALIKYLDEPVDRRVRYAELTDAGKAVTDAIYNRVSGRMARYTSAIKSNE